MNNSLENALFLIGYGLSVNARAHYLKLLPDDLADSVDERIRATTTVDIAGLDTGQRRLLGMLRRELVEEYEEDDQGETPVAEEHVADNLEETRATAAVESENGDEAAAETRQLSPEGAEADLTDTLTAETDVVAEAEVPNVLPVLLGILSLVAAREDAAALLGELPLHVQGELVQRLTTSTALNASRGLASQDAEWVEALRQRLDQSEQWGIEATCEILRALPDEGRLRRAITAAAQVDRAAVSILQNQLFVFEDILRLRDPEIQTLLLQIDNATIALALRMTDEPVKKRILQNVSSRRQVLIAEEGELYEGATLDEIEQAQAGILGTIRHLYEKGQISTYFGSIGRDEPMAETLELDLDELEALNSEEGEEEEEEAERKLGRYAVLLVAVALGVVLVVWLSGERSSRSTAAVKGSGASGSGSGKGAAAVVVQGSQAAAAGKAAGEKLGRAVLKMGQQLKVPQGIKAIVQLPGLMSEVEVEEGTQVWRQEGESGEEAELYARVGRMKTHVLDENFAVRTPVVKVSGRPGAVFHTRIVLDTSTIVEVIKGPVEVISLVEEGERYTLQSGEQGRFDPSGSSSISSLDLN